MARVNIGDAERDPNLELVAGLIGMPTPLQPNQVVLAGDQRLRVVRSLSIKEAREFRNEQLKNWPGLWAEGTAKFRGSRIHSPDDEPIADVDAGLHYYLVMPV